MSLRSGHQRRPVVVAVEVVGPDGHIRPWKWIESEIIDNAMRSCGFSVGKACEALGIGRSTFYRRFGPMR